MQILFILNIVMSLVFHYFISMYSFIISFPSISVINELVLVKYNDDIFYRAKVINRFDIENFKVGYCYILRSTLKSLPDIYEWSTIRIASTNYLYYYCYFNNKDFQSIFIICTYFFVYRFSIWIMAIVHL